MPPVYGARSPEPSTLAAVRQDRRWRGQVLAPALTWSHASAPSAGGRLRSLREAGKPRCKRALYCIRIGRGERILAGEVSARPRGGIIGRAQPFDLDDELLSRLRRGLKVQQRRPRPAIRSGAGKWRGSGGRSRPGRTRAIRGKSSFLITVGGAKIRCVHASSPAIPTRVKSA